MAVAAFEVISEQASTPWSAAAQRTLLVLAAIVILLAGLWAASGIVVPLLVAATVAIGFQPITDWLADRGVPPIVAALITVVCVLVVLAGVGVLLVLAARDLAGSADSYATELSAARERLLSWLDARGLDELASTVRGVEAGDAIGGLMREAALMASGVVGGLINVVLLVVFIQLEVGLLRDKLRILLARRPMDRTAAALAEVQKYLRVKFMLSLANGVLLGVWCALWGVSNPILWGVLAFALNFVPIIGSLIAAIPPVLLAAVELGWGSALGVAGGYVAVNILVDNVLEVRLMGRSLGLSPLVLMVSLLLWGLVLGPIGALLSVPITVAARIFFDYHPETRWLALLLAARGRDPKTPAG